MRLWCNLKRLNCDDGAKSAAPPREELEERRRADSAREGCVCTPHNAPRNPLLPRLQPHDGFLHRVPCEDAVH